MDQLPQGYKDLGFYPRNLMDGMISWYQYSGRFNLFDIFSLRTITFIAGWNADLYRFIYIFFMSCSVGFFYLILKSFKISNYCNILLCCGLFLYPLDVWTQYKMAEPRAIFFLMLGYYLIITSKSIYINLLGALSLFLAALTKESFIPAWVFGLSLIFWRNYDNKLTFVKNLLNIKKYIFIHLFFFSLLIIYISTLKLFLPIKNSGYVFHSNQQLSNFFIYLKTYLPYTLPILFSGKWLILFSIFLFFIYLYKFKNPKFTINDFFWTYLHPKELIILIPLFISIVGSILIYYFSNRPLGGHYILPTNFLMALFFALILESFYSKFILFHFKKRQVTSLVIASLLLVFLSLPFLDSLINVSIRERVDQNQWRKFVSEVKNSSPLNSHIYLQFQEPNMIETGQSLEANILFQGRYDLVFHLEFEDTSLYQKDSGFVKYLADSFNKDRPNPKKGESVVLVNADRKRKGISKPVSNPPLEDFQQLLFNPKDFFYKRYIKHKSPYLNYQIIYPRSD